MATYPGMTDLLGYWELNEASGNALDAHGANDLTETGGTIASATGKVGNCRDFEAGDTEYFTKAAPTALSWSRTMSVNVWVNLESATTSAWILDRIGANDGYGILLDATDHPVADLNGGLAMATSSEALNTATWYMLTLTYDANAGGVEELKIYVNAVKRGVADYDANIDYDPDPNIYLGCGNGTTAFFDGLIDELSIWRKALSQEEIDWLYDSGNGRSYGDLTGLPEIMRSVFII